MLLPLIKKSDNFAVYSNQIYFPSYDEKWRDRPGVNDTSNMYLKATRLPLMSYMRLRSSDLISALHIPHELWTRLYYAAFLLGYAVSLLSVHMII